MSVLPTRGHDTHMPEESEQPLPPRFRRLKIWLAVGLVVLLLLAGVRWWWGNLADARMTAYIEAAHARGEKVLAEDFAPDAIAESKNAAPLIRNATTQMSLTTPQNDWQNDFSSELPLSPSEISMIAAIQSDKKEALALLREARGRPMSAWNISLARPAYSTLLPHLNWMRQVANVAKYVALLEHTQGNDAEAIERVQDILRLHEVAGTSAPALVCHLVGVGICALDCELIQQLSGNLDVSATATPPATTRPASRAQIEQLIARLLDETAMRESAQLAWQGERMMMLDFAPYFGQRSAPQPLGWLLEPMIKLDALRVAKRYEGAATGPIQATYPAAMKSVIPQPSTTMPSRLQKMTRAFDANTAGGMARFPLMHFRVIVDRRAAAIMLALRLYALDHDLKLPPALDALVPRYLPAVPLDPFASDGRALGYVTATTQPGVYSIGDDGIDQGGSNAPIVPAIPGAARANKWQTLDVFYPMINAGTTGRSSTQPAR